MCMYYTCTLGTSRRRTIGAAAVNDEAGYVDFIDLFLILICANLEQLKLRFFSFSVYHYHATLFVNIMQLKRFQLLQQ